MKMATIIKSAAIRESFAKQKQWLVLLSNSCSCVRQRQMLKWRKQSKLDQQLLKFQDKIYNINRNVSIIRRILTVFSWGYLENKENLDFHQSLNVSCDPASNADPKAHRQQKANWCSRTSGDGSSSSASTAFKAELSSISVDWCYFY